MLRWSLTFLGVVLVIGLVYLRALASVEELAPLVPLAPAESAERVEPELDDAQATLVNAARAALEATPEPATVPGRALALRGRVLTPTGEPYGRATLRFATVRRGRAELEQTKSGPDGRFELAPAAPDARGDLLVTAQGHEFAPVARLDVAAGAEELELVLAPAQTFTVRFVDAQGVAHEPHELSFHWMLAGVTREDEDEALGKLRWSRSPVPFRIHVNDAHLQDEWLGPFEPDAVGDELVVDVRRRAFVHGIVLAGRAPIAGAEVRFEAVPDAAGRRGRAFGSTTTDASGEFHYRVDEPGTFRPVAFHARHGRGLGAEFASDGELDLHGLTIELVEPPGRIEGRILLPPGRSASELVVYLDSRTRTPRADGSFLLPEVEPGRRVVRIGRGDPAGPRDAWQWFSSEPVPWLGYLPTWSVEVRPGEASELTLDLVTPAPVRLEGRIELGTPVGDASTFGNYAAQGVSFRRDGWPALEGQAFLDSEGRFAQGFVDPGSRRVEVQLMLGDVPSLTASPMTVRSVVVQSVWMVRDTLELPLGLTSWELVLAPGALQLRTPGSELELSPGPDLFWQGPGEQTIRVQGWSTYASTQETLHYPAVPPGRVTFQLVPGGATYEATVRSGETTEFVFPESARDELGAAYDVRTTGLQLPSYLTEIGY